MTLENQVTSLELSVRLKELGVKQESYFWWGFQVKNIGGLINNTKYDLYPRKYGEGIIPKYSAFTVAELGEMLPPTLNYKNHRVEFKPDNRYTLKNHYGITYEGMCNCCFKKGFTTEYCATESDARAKMLIYLLENDLINQ